MDRAKSWVIVALLPFVGPASASAEPPTIVSITPSPGTVSPRACGVEEIIIAFSEDVVVSDTDFTVHTQSHGEQPFTLLYDGTAHVARLDLATPLPDADRVMLSINRSIASRATGQTLGDAGGEFFFATLAGDVDHSGVVTMADVTAIRDAVNTSAADHPDMDVNCNGLINVADMVTALRRLDNSLPEPHPAVLQLQPGGETVIQVGSTLQLAVAGKFFDGRAADLTASSTGTTYQSSAPTAVAVSPDGLISSLAVGQATITASNTGLTDFLVVTSGLCTSDQTCDDGNPCTTDSCNPLTGCVNTLDPTCDIRPPDVRITVAPGVVNPGQPVTITVQAVDDVGVASVALTVNGAPVALNAGNQAVFTPSTAGTYIARATATDLVGKTGSDQTSFLALGPSSSPPTVAINTPAADAEIKVPTEIIGTASDDNLYRYTLAYRAIGSGEFIEFVTGYASITNGVLGVLDPTQMTNGVYEIRLRAEDVSGQFAEVMRPYKLSGNMKVGNFTISFNDMSISVAGIPITVTRTYDSRVKTKGDFGIGWTMDLASLKLEENALLGGNWVQTSSGGWFPTYYLQPNGSRTVSIAWPDGRTESFRMTVQPSAQQLAPIYAISRIFFTPIPPATSSLSPVGNVSEYYFDEGQVTDGDIFSDFETLQPYDPDGYVLTTVEGTEYTFAGPPNSRVAKLQSIKDLNGNTIQFTANGVVHSAGKSILFTRDGQGRITQITDPMGNTVRYTYDARSDLASVTDQAGNTTTFTYNFDHGLIEIRDPRGIGVARQVYDDAGRLIAVIDADGNRVDFCRDDPVRCPLPEGCTRHETVFNRLNQPTIYCYDDDGNVRLQIDALGNRRVYTYDDRNNKTSEIDPLGHTTTYTYNANNNMLTQTDPLGHTTTYTYNSRGQVLTTTDCLGHVTTNEYDANGNLIKTTDPLGYVTTNAYDARGNHTSTTDCLGNVTTYTYDPYGNMLTQTDALGHTTTYTYDANGNRLTETTTRTLPGGDKETITTTYAYDSLNRLIRTTDTYGNSTSTEFWEFGKEKARTDKLGRRTEMYYDFRGNLDHVVHPDGTTETYTYDAEGRRLTATDRGGRITSYTYDALGRVIRTTYPDGATVSAENDAAGRVSASIDARGNRTEHEYDAAGRNISITDALGHITTYAYDCTGSRTTLTDANGHTVTYGYDANNRQTRTIFPDTTFTCTDYDCLGRKSGDTNQAGVQTVFGYDLLGRLTSVTDALGGVTSYAYDELGNRITQTDAEGNATPTEGDRTTRMEYDALGRMKARILPLGQRETFDYDPQGNQLHHTDFNGATTEFEYDLNDRMSEKRLPKTAISASLTGSQEVPPVTTTATGSCTATLNTTYTQLQESCMHDVTAPTGAHIHHAASGQNDPVVFDLGSASSPIEATWSLSAVDRDALLAGNLYVNIHSSAHPDGEIRGQLQAQSGEIVVFEYNPCCGQRTRAGGDTYTYALRGRLDTETKANGDVLSYTYDPAGNRTSVTTPAGTTFYAFDALNRLATVTDPDGGVTTYTYDTVGNRASVAYPNGTVAEYTYDSLNRLTNLLNRKAGGEVISSYAYTLGPTGNRTRVVENTGRTVDYAYDPLYRLTQEGINDPTTGLMTIAYTYDKVGNRLLKTATAGASHTDTAYTYNDNDRLLTESETVTLVEGPINTGNKRLAVHDPRPSQTAGYILATFMTASFAPFLLPVALLLPRRGRIGRMARRRAAFIRAVGLFLLPIMSIAPDRVWATHIEAMENVAKAQALAAIGLGSPAITTYSYDANGNTLSRAAATTTDTYTYDFENRLIAGDLQSGSQPGPVAYTYDADGIRSSKTAGGATMQYLTDKNQPFAQVLLETDGTTPVSYVYGDDLVSMKRPDSGTSYYHYDGQMSTRALTGGTAAPTDTYTYDAFGNLLATTGMTVNNYKYTGEQYDPNVAFYYLRARYYNQANGRFTTMDPARGSDFEPLTHNSYGYVRADPADRTDPSGRFDLFIAMLSLSIATILLGIVHVSFAGSPGIKCSDPGIEAYRQALWTTNTNPSLWHAGFVVCGTGQPREDIDFGPRQQQSPGQASGQCPWAENTWDQINHATKTKETTRLWGNLGAGKGKGKRCREAECADIRDCLKDTCAKWNQKSFGPMVCWHFVADVEDRCCIGQGNTSLCE